MSDTSESDSEFLTQAFPVPESDLSDPPDLQKALTSPEEYIRFVRHEAESYPDIFYSSPPIEEINGDVSVSENISSTNTRNSTEQELHWITQFYETVEEYQFCKSILLDDPTTKERHATQDIVNSNLFDTVPSLTWVATRRRVQIEELLELLASHCTRKRWKPNMINWIFAVCVALEQPIHPDTCHNLRAIAKRCRKLKQELEHSMSESEIQFCNMYPYLVAKVFGQHDLLDV